jgi:hypothetical protein
MNYRVLKTLTVTAHLCLLWLTWKLLTGQHDWALGSGALAVGGFWLGMTVYQLRSLFATYFDRLSRLQILVPLTLSVVLASIALFCQGHWSMKAIAGAELVGWGIVYVMYRRNKAEFQKQGHGLLPKGTWVSPPAEALQPGDLILTSGRMAERLHDSVGHGEVVFRANDGTLHTFTSYMERGALRHSLESIIRSLRIKNIHYVVLRLRTPLTEEQLAAGEPVADALIAANVEWIKSTNAWRERTINKLWLPASWKAWLVRNTKATGYDWLGLFMGFLASNRWTCVGGCLTWYDLVGVKMRKYGTGLLGLGTGFLNPIMPIRFLSDPNLELLGDKHREEYQKQGSRATE